MAGARTAEEFTSPYQLYAGLLGKLFHTITQGHPEPQKLLQEVLDSAIEEFNRTVLENCRFYLQRSRPELVLNMIEAVLTRIIHEAFRLQKQSALRALRLCSGS
jgi:hypothetical protein